MKIILIDERISQKCEMSLARLGYNVYKLPPDPDLGEAVSSHPDTLMFASKGEIMTTADYCDCAAYIFSDLREICPNVRVSFTSDRRSAKYPLDCSLNALLIGNKLFCKIDSASPALLDLAKEKGFDVIHTNQGYPACCVLAFGNSAITADDGMANTLTNHGINVLKIKQGHIALPPYEYGFIGGASFVDRDKVYFFGNINDHPDGEKICDFIRMAGYLPVSLSDEPLTDLGGAVIP